MDSKLTSATENLISELGYENEKLVENMARCDSENAAVRDEFNAKLSSEIRVVLDKIDDVSREAENKIATLTSNTKSVRECET
jgi:hypothetical protein